MGVHLIPACVGEKLNENDQEMAKWEEFQPLVAAIFLPMKADLLLNE